MDAFLDENLDYAARLSNAGVPTELHVYPGVIHCGFGARPSTPRTAQLPHGVYGALALPFEPLSVPDVSVPAGLGSPR